MFHDADLVGMYSRAMIEYMAFLYLRCLSFEQIRSIMRAWFGDDVVSKHTLLNHVEEIADSVPEHLAVTKWLKPRRSGYYALDGTYMHYRGEEFVLLILLDVETLDVVAYAVTKEETEASYQALIDSVNDEISGGIKGFFCDGELGLLRSLRLTYPGIPVQLCVFHKYSRVGQVACFVRPKTEMDREIKRRVELVLFAPTKQEAIEALHNLQRYAREHQSSQKLRQVIGVLKRNFDLLLTHYDHPEMSPYNNILEGFNYLIKRRTNLMKGLKKAANVHRWMKLLILDWRFHPLTDSAFKRRRGNSPLELALCDLPKFPNWISYVRKKYKK
ncbi:MAG: transposase [Candidatus Uhrbacteria bacterium]